MSFWDAFFLCLIYLPLVLLWGFALFDVFDREDLSGAWKAVWVAVIVLVPFFGTLVYLFVRRPGARAAQRAGTDRGDHYTARLRAVVDGRAAVAAGRAARPRQAHGRGVLDREGAAARTRPRHGALTISAA